jgi:hypothetical protein
MVDYCTLAEAKRQLSILTTDTDDDALIEDLITENSRFIDRYCNRHFYAATETRTFNPDTDTHGAILFVDKDLLTIETLTNGDGEELDAANYVLLTPNYTPKWAVQLKSGSSKSWTWQDSPENAISIEGTWGYNNGTVPPDEIRLACKKLVAWEYKHRQAVFQSTGAAAAGQAPIPLDIPKDIRDTLDLFKRQENRAV